MRIRSRAALAATPAHAWNSRTHQLIVRLAIGGLPASPLKTIFERNTDQLQEFAIEPDSVLRPRYGEIEGRRHYINLEYFGPDPFAALVPDFAAMNKRFGVSTVRRAGTLPWTIEEFSDALKRAWSRGDCAEVLRLAGFLGHYVGDASQPLHTTVHFDGYEGDGGVHMRIELAVDDNARVLGDAATEHIQLLTNQSPWAAAIQEIRESNSHVDQLLQADRAGRILWPRNRAEYDRALLSRTRAILVDQIALAASVLTSIWIMEWKRSGPNSICTNPVGHPAASVQP